MKQNHESQIEQLNLRHLTETNHHLETIKNLQLSSPHTTVDQKKPSKNVPQLTLKLLPGSNCFHLKAKFKCNLEKNASQTGQSPNGTKWYKLSSNFMKIESGQVALCLEKHVLIRPNSLIKKESTYIVNLQFKKLNTIQKVEADWKTNVTWKRMLEVIESTSSLSHCFRKEFEQGGSQIKPLPESSAELTINLTVKSWVVTNVQQPIQNNLIIL